jgi:hypothetical protein
MEWKQQVLEELIYERVRLHVDLMSLIDFERELEESIGRALRELRSDESDAESLTRRFVEAAWRRVEAEWEEERKREEDACPLCTPALDCSVPAG